jgi:hypothetical protein
VSGLITILGWIAFSIGVCVLTWGALGLSGLILFCVMRWATSESILFVDDMPKIWLACSAVLYGALTLYFVISYYVIVIRDKCKNSRKETPINPDKFK